MAGFINNIALGEQGACFSRGETRPERTQKQLVLTSAKGRGFFNVFSVCARGLVPQAPRPEFPASKLVLINHYSKNTPL